MSEKYKVGDSLQPYFITTTIVDWVDLFTRQVYCDIFMDSLLYCSAHKGLLVHAYCLMPSHVHLILSSQGEPLPAIMRDLKKFTSKAFVETIDSQVESRRAWLLKKFAFAAERTRRGVYHKVWQDGFHPMELFSYKIMIQKLDYLHNNPVKAGYVFSPEDWVYSSAGAYAGRVRAERLALQMLL
ncbi:MAG: REP-associated tyrosine transposase [Cyclobacteriaceae bacterium]